MIGWVEVEYLHPIELLGHTLFAIVLVIEPDVWNRRKYAVMCVRRIRHLEPSTHTILPAVSLNHVCNMTRAYRKASRIAPG